MARREGPANVRRHVEGGGSRIMMLHYTLPLPPHPPTPKGRGRPPHLCVPYHWKHIWRYIEDHLGCGRVRQIHVHQPYGMPPGVQGLGFGNTSPRPRQET